MENILQTHKLNKIIGNKEIISDVDIHVSKGNIYGFLGPNGAGKTTVLKLITNLWKPTSGEIELFGEKLTPTSYEVLKRIGSIIEFPVFNEGLSGKENLDLHCEYMGYYSKDSVSNALELLELTDTGNKPVHSYSLGMRQRLGIARAILTKPEFLVLDEPTNGLDPAGMKKIRNILKMLSHDYGITIMISSHILSEIQSIANTIGVINHGKMIKEISMKEISEINVACIELVTPDIRRASYILTEQLHIDNFKILDNSIIQIYERQLSCNELSKALALNNVEIDSINKKAESLEDYFLKMTEEDNK